MGGYDCWKLQNANRFSFIVDIRNQQKIHQTFPLSLCWNSFSLRKTSLSSMKEACQKIIEEKGNDLFQRASQVSKKCSFPQFYQKWPQKLEFSKILLKDQHQKMLKEINHICSVASALPKTQNSSFFYIFGLQEDWTTKFFTVCFFSLGGLNIRILCHEIEVFWEYFEKIEKSIEKFVSESGKNLAFFR